LTASHALAQQQSQDPQRSDAQRDAQRSDAQRGTEQDSRQQRDSQQQSQQGQQQQSRQGQGDVTLGVRLGPSPTTGVLIRDVQPQSPAAQGGLQSGDYILSINGQEIDSMEKFDQAISQISQGETAELVVWRNRQREQLQVRFNGQQQSGFRPESGTRGRQSSGQSQGDAWLGIQLQETQAGEQGQGRQQEGVEIARVYPSGPAARAGLYSSDRLVEIDGQKVTNAEDVVEIVSKAQPNKEIKLVVMRDDERETLTAVLGDRRDFFGDSQFQQQQFQGQSDQGEEFQSFRDHGVPEHSMLLEQHRRFAEQHQRIEEKLDQVLEELAALRQQRGQGGQGASAPDQNRPQPRRGARGDSGL
jgi:C-terminal processing protease CtpA/Prc